MRFLALVPSLQLIFIMGKRGCRKMKLEISIIANTLKTTSYPSFNTTSTTSTKPRSNFHSRGNINSTRV